MKENAIFNMIKNALFKWISKKKNLTNPKLFQPKIRQTNALTMRNRSITKFSDGILLIFLFSYFEFVNTFKNNSKRIHI